MSLELFVSGHMKSLWFRKKSQTNCGKKNGLQKSDFLHKNILCNNGDKTELLIIGTPQQLNKLKVSSIMVDNIEIKTAENVCDLGVVLTVL